MCITHDALRKLRGKKRHPTIKDNVIIYAGTTILEGKTVVGKDTVNGDNFCITSSIPSNMTVTTSSPKLSYKTKKSKKTYSRPRK